MAVRTGTGFKGNLRPVAVPEGVHSVEDMHKELQHMINVLLDRVKVSAVDYADPLALMKIAGAYYARAREIEFIIYSMERDKLVNGKRGSQDQYHLFRTGELTSFINLAKASMDEGSRRLSAEQLVENHRSA